ncbi:MAG: fibronectin type III-like domain-contianing protein, partial [Clostridiales bacterium]|nr:fibronectin type III-like domain-contianing protein [Clostridiales bacterium]
TLQLYVSLPQGKLDQPYQVLAAFNKTDEIGPGQTTKIDLSFCLSDIASYDPTCERYVLEEGKYVLRLGTSSKNTTVIGGIQIDETVTVRKVKNLLGDPGFVDYKPEAITDKISDVDYLKFDSSSISLQEVTYDKPCDIDRSFAEGLSDEELAYLVVGGFDPEGGFLSVIGNASMSVAGAAGETTGLLKEKGIKPVVMADGPAGVRISKDYIVRDGKVLSLGLSIPETMQEYIPKIGLLLMKIAGNKPRKGEQIRHQYCTAIPIGTAIAQSWNTSFARICGEIVGDEMERFGVHLWLAPALNIHRDIRCGRNFEYYSEDPLISGMMSAAITNGVQAHKGCGVTIKHFCANNQETNRYNSNSRVSERAMREIYLKGFEICVKNSSPASVMTSYNLLNGTHTSESGPLIRNILRDEFGFEGIVMTDWIVNGGTVDKTSVYPAPEAWKVVNAGGDLFMPGGKPDYDVVLSAVKDGRVTREQLITNAARVINYSNMVR